MRILIPIIAFARAGGYRVLARLADHWIEFGASVDFLVDQRTDPPYFPTRAGIRRFNTNGFEVAATACHGRFAPAGGNSVSIFLGMWRALRRLSGEYDVILANQSLTAWPVWMAPPPRRGSQGRFYYVQAYEPDFYTDERGLKNRVLGALSAFSYGLPLTQVANAPMYLGYRGITAREWVPPGLDEALFQRRPTARAVSGSAVWTLGTIGRREPVKGTEDVLAAFELLARRRDDVRLSIAYGNLPPGWSHPHAEVVVPADDAALAAYYRSLDLLLVAGRLQLGACHYPVIEAMASGVPVVTTGYTPSSTDNAWIVPVRSPAALADAAEAIMNSTPDQVAAKLDLAELQTRPFRWPVVAKRFLGLMQAA